LTYLTSLPLDAMNSVEKRTFDGDGAEIIYGLLLDSYKNGDYPGVVRLWEVYSPKYNLKVAQDSHVNFIVTNSYLKLRMYKSFDRSFDRFKKLQKTVHRTFPIWIERREDESAENLLSEIKVLKELYAMKWDLADEALESLKDVKSFYPKFHYYKSLISYKRKKFEVSSENAELFIVKNKRDDLLSDEEFANLLEAYYESTYALGKLDKFKTVVMAFLKDFEKKKKRTQFIEDSVEKISYLLIETLAGENNKESYVQLEEIIKNFLKRYSKSVYSGRTKFLYGVSLVNNDKESEGIKILTKLLSDESVPKYIQELARTEISSIKLKNNSI